MAAAAASVHTQQRTGRYAAGTHAATCGTNLKENQHEMGKTRCR
jgi:hypothetical protein